ncbi:MAG: hypothetical protein PHH04_02610 [Thomasclavelia sp.]|jgi:hypothetical protein|nr:hypothetical protein [Thomasclavelia sp.]
MGFKEDLEARKQRKEAKAYFNQNNDAKFSGGDWAKIIMGSLLISTLGALIIEYISSIIHFRLGFFIVLLAYLIVKAGAYLARGYNSDNLAIALTVTYVLGIILGILIYEFIYYFNIGMSFSSLLNPIMLQTMLNFVAAELIRRPITLIMYLIGAYYIYSNCKG